MNKIETSIFVSRIAAICDEMGTRLKQAAFSPNIKERLDFSCALFDEQGQLFAQAAHIPVHLGSMAYAMQAVVGTMDWCEGDSIIFNDPYTGGTHLPDVTVVTPFFSQTQTRHLLGFVANRAHHANIGSDSPGSMPLSDHIDQEGLIIKPTHIVKKYNLVPDVFETLTGVKLSQNTATMPQHDATLIQRLGDLNAQLSANRTGIERLKDWCSSQEQCSTLKEGIQAVNLYGQDLMEQCIDQLPDGRFEAWDWLDDDGQGQTQIMIKVAIIIQQKQLFVDFSGTSAPVKGNVNCPKAVVYAAVYYVLRCLLPHYTPDCAGIMKPVTVYVPEVCLLNALPPSAVAAGNVETSMRIVDVLLAALAKALPERIPAMAQGTMNNVAMGVPSHWDYYETVGGGYGASPRYDGLSGVQCHLTNTLNTPIESIERHYPLRILRYQLRQNSGGMGHYRGGDGLLREYQFLKHTQITLLTERRDIGPCGLQGGLSGQVGLNQFNGERLPAKTTIQAKPGDVLTIETPGGGGWGNPQ